VTGSELPAATVIVLATDMTAARRHARRLTANSTGHRNPSAITGVEPSRKREDHELRLEYLRWWFAINRDFA
jgi:hypothetical protein